MLKSVRLVLALLILVGGTPLMAQVPTFVPIQGYIVDADGNGLDGEYVLTFAIYDADACEARLVLLRE